jgi:hypothetical protein
VKHGLSDYASNAKVTQDICRTGLPRGPGAAHLNLGFVISENRPPPRALVLDHRCRCPSAIPPRFRLIYRLDVRSVRAAGDGRSRRRARFVPSTGRETRLRPTGRPGVRLLAGIHFASGQPMKPCFAGICLRSASGERGSMMGSRTSFRVIGEGEQFLIVVPHGNIVREYFRVNDDPVLARVCCPVREGQSRKLARRSPTRRRPQYGNVVTPPADTNPGSIAVAATGLDVATLHTLTRVDIQLSPPTWSPPEHRRGAIPSERPRCRLRSSKAQECRGGSARLASLAGRSIS